MILVWATVSLALEFPSVPYTLQLWHAATVAFLFWSAITFSTIPPAARNNPFLPCGGRLPNRCRSTGFALATRWPKCFTTTAMPTIWAHLAGATIAADIPYSEEKDFWADPADVQRNMEQVLSQTGVKFLVTNDPPFLPPGSGWQRIPGTGYAFLSLSSLQ